MQTVGTLLGGAVLAYVLVAIAQVLRQGTIARQKGELGLTLLREQLKAASALRARREQERLLWNGTRKFQVERKVHEADGVCSFYFVPHDRKPLPLFKPGQFLTFRLNVPGHDRPVIRCYSLSCGPNSDYYRITVKRVEGGTASNFLIDHIEEGAIVDCQSPRGDFVLDPLGVRPAVLIAGGVGITPFTSMMDAVARFGQGRELLLFYGLQNSSQHALRDEIQKLADANENFQVFNVYSRPGENDREGETYDHKGRVGVELFKKLLPSNNYEYYLCGPSQMMDSVIEQLREWGVPESNIFAEAFGARSVKAIGEHDTATAGAEKNASPADGSTELKVEFSRSSKDTKWTTTAGDLLSLAASLGISIDSGCGAGSCGTCQTAVRKGKVRYPSPPGFTCEDGTCLPCVAVPDGDLVLDA